MLFDLLFVSGHPFSVVSVLREIDVEVVFSHYAYVCVCICVCVCVL
jgi:hypothetical protein